MKKIILLLIITMLFLIITGCSEDIEMNMPTNIKIHSASITEDRDFMINCRNYGKEGKGRIELILDGQKIKTIDIYVNKTITVIFPKNYISTMPTIANLYSDQDNSWVLTDSYIFD